MTSHPLHRRTFLQELGVAGDVVAELAAALLQRLADREGVTAQQLCERLSRQTGYKIATVDVLLWRACANGVFNSRTGEFRAPDRPSKVEE